MENPFLAFQQYLSGVSGLDLESTKILTCLVVSFPASAIFKRLPDKNILLKNVYIVAVSAIFIAFILQIRSGFFILLFNSMFTYVITRYYRSPLMPWVNFIVLMLLMCMSHLKSQFQRLNPDNVDIDITGAQMVLVMKLTSYAWSYRDGILYKKDRNRFNRELNQFQKSRAILSQPSLISYLGYSFFYGSIVTGPSFDFADYQRFILTDVFDDVPAEKRPGKRRKRKIPHSGKVALLKVVQGLFWAALMFVLRPRFPTEYEVTGEFRHERSFLYRICYMWAVSFVFRLKYYAAWSISEASCIVAGLGYNGYDPVKKKMYWNRVQNIDPKAFETGQNIHDCLEAWNMNTNKWLKNFVYLRCCNIDRETGKPSRGVLPTFATFATSAFWHGTMPGYYMTFIAGAIIQTVGRVFRHNLRPMFISKDGSNVSTFKKLYDLVCWVVTQLSFGYIVGPFIFLTFKRSMLLWAGVYFWVHVGSFAVFFIFNGPYAKQVKIFFQNRALRSTALQEPDHGTEKTELQAEKSEKAKDDILTHSNQSLTSLPTFDKQSELHDSVGVLDVDMESNIDRITEEFQEWKREATKGKKAQQLTNEEIEHLKEGLTKLQGDLNDYIGSLDTLSDSKKKKD